MDAYTAYLRSPEWKAKRLAKLRQCEWDGYGYCRCPWCKMFVYQNYLHIHHLTYERVFNEPLSDLIVACAGCHAAFHDKIPPAWWTYCAAHRLTGYVPNELYGLHTIGESLQSYLESLCMRRPTGAE